ncbi:hypothetical protein GOH09_22695 [Escherichia coli]|nr:hypothetical protein [Escherichia coli]EFH4205776.1 hypothetical protein [Escherichia coli]EFH9096981.1 hypothetical protein [Escherichia coli]EFH9705997.1 helix-turn-helix domain-containing protein [Escherichia coli]EFO9272634.1 helix-turn-helix domain-containing protein [Escherichia coli]
MKAYWDSLTKEQQGELAGKVGSTPGYLRLVFNGYKKASFVLAKKLEQCTSGAITKSDLRPDSANNSLSGAANSPGSAGVAPGGSAGDSPRTSHSFEPVKEPVNEPIAVGASVDESVRVRSNRPEYSPEFEQAWLAYPKRAGGNSKSAAFKAWKARLNEGVNPETMLEGVKRYAGWVSAMGNSGTQFVKQAVTFFGPDRHFEEFWEVPAVSAARREDPYFKASYDNVDYSQIPAGFRG